MARGKKRALAIALSLTTSVLGVPLSASTSASAAIIDTSEWPTWLLAPDIDINPPAPVPDSSTAPPVARGYVITADALPKFDITATDAAQAELRAFASRLASNHDVAIDTTRYRVYAMPSIRAASDAEATRRTVDAAIESVDVDAMLVGDGLPALAEAAEDPAHAIPAGTDVVTDAIEGTVDDLAILPVGASVNYLGAAWEDATVMVTTALDTTPLAPATGVLSVMPAPAANNGWDPQTPNCPNRKQNGTAWFDTCDQWAHLAKDGDPNRGTWALSQWGSAKSKGVYELTRFENHSRRAKGSADQKWLDWSPRATADAGNCHSESVGVNVASAYWERSENHCDWWVIDKRNPEVYFTNEWQGRAYKIIRAVSANHAFSVPNGTYPICNVRYDYYAKYKW